MEVSGINSNTPPNPNNSPWTQLIHLYSQLQSLWADMQAHPQDRIKDVGQMVAIAQKMDAIASKLPTPPSAPTFHQDFNILVSSLQQLDSSLQSGITNNPNIPIDLENVGQEITNIFFDIM